MLRSRVPRPWAWIIGVVGCSLLSGLFATGCPTGCAMDAEQERAEIRARLASVGWGVASTGEVTRGVEGAAEPGTLLNELHGLAEEDRLFRASFPERARRQPWKQRWVDGRRSAGRFSSPR